ncbi:hypothetical protein GGR38_003714 [Novosphingobium sediminicola]|uniref:Uncharacterized protein n=1 Tax=Novosphingobium sediminicola TaxID=563162 RepID=A0A7W6CHN7_9SPHN|nr:hypothetical protein [Novosphingobium sediminicola]
MSKTRALILDHGLEAVRLLLVVGCALALILAGRI